MTQTFTKQASDMQLTSLDVSKGQIEAVITSYNNYDRDNDRMKEGALTKFIKNFDGQLPMLFQHNKADIIGEWTDIYTKGNLVIGKGQIYPEVSKGADAMALISRGMVGSTSIGFRSSDFQINKQGGRDFKEIELFEVSLVQRPANAKAEIISAKQDDGSVDLRAIEKVLRDVGLTHKETKALIAEGKNALRDVVDSELQEQELLINLHSLIKEL